MSINVGAAIQYRDFFSVIQLHRRTLSTIMSPLSADSTVSVTPSPSTSPENKYSKSLGSSAYILSHDSKQISRIIFALDDGLDVVKD